MVSVVKEHGVADLGGPRPGAGETLITHEFSYHRGQTTVTTRLRSATPEGRDVVLHYPKARGMGESGARLVDLLTDLPSNNRKELP